MIEDKYRIEPLCFYTIMYVIPFFCIRDFLYKEKTETSVYRLVNIKILGNYMNIFKEII